MNTVIVGCGSVASRWVRVLNTDPRITITGLVDADPARADRLAERYDLRVPRFSSLNHAVAAQSYDLAVNLTPPHDHAALSRAALTAGLHVLTEKPLATSLDDATGLVCLAEQVGRTIAVMQNRGRDPGFRSFCDKINGRPGPFAVAADVCVELHQPGFRAEQRFPVTGDLAVHAFDQVQAIINAAPIHVTCVEKPTPFLGSHCSLASIAVEFADGSVFTYRGGYTGVGLRTSANGLWRVDGPNAAARWHDKPSTLHPADAPAVTGPAPGDSSPGYQVCIIAMIDALHDRSAAAPMVNLRSVALLEAALASANTGGRPVAVADVPGGRP